MQLALGLDLFLDAFAAKHEATMLKRISPDPDLWFEHLRALVADETVTFLWNLTGVDVWEGLTRAASGSGGGTDKELLFFREHAALWSRTEWMRDEQAVTNPFA